MDENAQASKEPLSVYTVVMVLMDQIAELGWIKLGLHPDPVTGEVKADLEEAKVAIDLAAHLASVMESRLDDADRRQLQGLVRDLRLNYVNKVNG